MIRPVSDHKKRNFDHDASRGDRQSWAHRQRLIVNLRTNPMSAPPTSQPYVRTTLPGEDARLSLFDCQQRIEMREAEVARIIEKAPPNPRRPLQQFMSAGGEFAAGFGRILPPKTGINATFVHDKIASPPPHFPLISETEISLFTSRDVRHRLRGCVVDRRSPGPPRS